MKDGVEGSVQLHSEPGAGEGGGGGGCMNEEVDCRQGDGVSGTSIRTRPVCSATRRCSTHSVAGCEICIAGGVAS